jgi:hypothetical protein
LARPASSATPAFMPVDCFPRNLDAAAAQHRQVFIEDLTGF